MNLAELEEESLRRREKVEQEAVQMMRDAVDLIDSRRELAKWELEQILSLEVVALSSAGIQDEFLDGMLTLQKQFAELDR